MKKSLFFLCISLVLVLFSDCRKDKKKKAENGDPQYVPTEIQIALPAGTNIDLSQTTVFSLFKVSPVGADGKSTIAFNPGTCELAFLFDAQDHLLLMGFISDESKEISAASTAQALLFMGLDGFYSESAETKLASLKQILKYQLWGQYAKEIEQVFVNNPLMFSQGTYLEPVVNMVNEITNLQTIDPFGRQVKVEDADKTKSGLTAKEKDDETAEVINSYFRRGHAFLYKVAYKDDNGSHTLISDIGGSTEPTKELSIPGAEKNKGSITSEGISLPLEEWEKEATWKLRVVGPGGMDRLYGAPTLTGKEAAKLEDMWADYFAVDLLMPVLLNIMNQTSYQWNVRPNNIEEVRPFIDKARAIAGEMGSISGIKQGKYRETVYSYLKSFAEKPYRWEDLATSLIACMKGKTGKYVQYENDVKEQFAKVKPILEIIAAINDPASASKGIGGNLTYLHNDLYDQYVTVDQNCMTMDEWTIKSKNNDVNIVPKNSDVMAFTNHTLTVKTNPDLNPGETLEYKWTTAGQFGVLKNGTQEGTSFTTSTNKITYYGKTTPNKENIEKVNVTVYIKGSSGSRELGSDEATINVKKIKAEIKPDDATLSPIRGLKAVTLRVLNSDGTNPITNFGPNAAIQFKVVWNTPGAYGHFSGNSTNVTTQGNSVTYIATDEEVKSGKEKITAQIYFKLASGGGWILRDSASAEVEVTNDLKKIVYYTSPQAVHNHSPNCAVGAIVLVKKVPDAVSYSVNVTGLTNKNYPTFNDSWNVTGTEKHVRGYAGYAFNEPDAGEDYFVGIYGTFTWSGGPSPNHHGPASSAGVAKVTVMVKQ